MLLGGSRGGSGWGCAFGLNAPTSLLVSAANASASWRLGRWHRWVQSCPAKSRRLTTIEPKGATASGARIMPLRTQSKAAETHALTGLEIGRAGSAVAG